MKNGEDEKNGRAEEDIKNFLKAAEIGKKIFSEINLKPGMKIKEIVEDIERKIKENGGEIAFPVNVSCNEFAAHDTASKNDERIITEKDLVKIDIGIHIDGCIVDSAITIDLSGEHPKLVEASAEALENAISIMRAGKSTSEIGKIIEETIKKHGYTPIENLGGHSLEKYNLHSGIEIPNYAARSGEILKEGDIIAIEPFATNGAGKVVETPRCEIFSTFLLQPTRNRNARILFENLVEKFKGLPFAERWLNEDKIAFIELVRNGSLKKYPVLKEKNNGMVSQFEHTVIVEKDSVRILL